ncbi:diaminohydroxyphosphoribosylaminopyrimidine deaminase [Verrucomicrobium sp. GAS474]|nr:diaminohydroxyphosphoribosylaminopyrimidine deaminase [Verrucomicrobium sp. GAS474]
MSRALALARTRLGRTSPNPAVGAVLWKKGKVIGEGRHLRAGRPHAEVEAVRDARRRGHSSKGATLYVTLEPCSTCGRTPACTDLIRREEIARVVVAAKDPNPHHAGAGFRILKKAGIEVAHGLFAKESAALNRAFNKWIVTGLPWVTAKIALSLDGGIAPREGDDRWLTSAAARRQAHRLRLEADAVVVGGTTARRDNPRLTVRLGREGAGKTQPWRIVWSKGGRPFDRSLHLFSDVHRDRTRVVRGGTLAALLAGLGGEGVTHVLIEGGGGVLGEAFREGVVDEAAFFLAPVMLGRGTEVPALAPALLLPTGRLDVALEDAIFTKLGPDLLCQARVITR